MKKTSIILGTIVTLVLSSCVVKTGPENDVGFSNVEDIKQLNGCYINLADGQDKSKYSTRLSKYLWKSEKIKHHNIMTICVNILDNNIIEVKAKNLKKTLYIKRFIKNKDFSLNSGTITLNKPTGINSGGVAGVGFESLSIGLDKRGDGRISNGGAHVGIMLLIPYAIVGESSYRFLRVK